MNVRKPRPAGESKVHKGRRSAVKRPSVARGTPSGRQEASSGRVSSVEPQLQPELEKWIEKARSLPAVRKDLVERVKAEIAAGTYETPERIQIAVERLLDEIGL